MRASADGQPVPAGDYGCRTASGVALLAAEYRGFLLDQWGVLHDGTRPYAGALECLRRLRAAGKRIVVLSNSGKRESENLRLMARMGFDPALFDRFISAGEDARSALGVRTSPFHASLGRRCFAFTRAGDRALLEGLGLEFVDDVREADFLAVIGNDSPRRTARDYEPELRAGVKRNLRMICANPDLARLTPEGIVEAPGVIARRYEALGGPVFWHGKPHPPIYDACLEALGCERHEVIAVGDSMEHDVLGAARVGLACALIPGGVHGAALGIAWGEWPRAQRWRAFAAGAEAAPQWLLRAFNW